MNVRHHHAYDSAPSDADSLRSAGFRHIDTLRRLVREVGVPAVVKYGARSPLILHSSDFSNDSRSSRAVG